MFAATTGFILAVQVVAVWSACKQKRSVSEESTCSADLGIGIGLLKQAYRHLYRLQVYLLEPFFTGYLLSLMLSSRQLIEGGVEASVAVTVNLVLASLVAFVQSLFYCSLVQACLPTRSLL